MTVLKNQPESDKALAMLKEVSSRSLVSSGLRAPGGVHQEEVERGSARMRE